MKQQTRQLLSQKTELVLGLLIAFFLIANHAFSQSHVNSDDARLLDQYINSKYQSGFIVFDSTNIKQFWFDKSVQSKNNSIHVSLDNKGKSIPLKIQLANVAVSDDCKVEVFTDDPAVAFTITNSSAKTISTSKREDDFIYYHVASSVFHLEEVKDFSFNMVFNSNGASSISIRKIVISFSNNAIFLSSPGVLKLTKDNTWFYSANPVGTGGFSVKGVKSELWSKTKILIDNNTLKATAKVKNTGNTAARIYFGYAVRSSNGTVLDGKFYPYNNSCKVLTVISGGKGSSRITVNSTSGWTKGCYLALNADSEYADVPNSSFADGTIVDIKTVKDGVVEITMSKPLTKEIKKGTKVRVHGPQGAKLYTNRKVLQPGEEETFTSEIRKDANYPFYSANCFSKGCYYVEPLLFSYSVDSEKENTISISEFTVAY